MSELEEILPEGWETDGYGIDSCLVVPDCGCVIEQDGQCQHGVESPLIAMGMI